MLLGEILPAHSSVIPDRRQLYAAVSNRAELAFVAKSTLYRTAI